MTTYGTIPTTTPPASSNLEFVSRAKERIRSGLGTRRPWKEMIHLHAINLPTSSGEAMLRLRTNLAYFRTNYAIVALFLLFLSLLWHPISLIVFVIMMAAWLFLYFLRDEPLLIFGRTIDDRVVLVFLSIVTIVLLFLTDVTVNIIVGLVIGVVVVLIHGTFRKIDDLFVDDVDQVGSGLLLRGRDVAATVPLKETASSSFSSSS